MRVADWERFQGYKKRGPEWIKAYLSLLDQPQYLTLPLSAAAILHDLWLTAARISEVGELPDDVGVLAVLSHRPETALREAIPYLCAAGFITCDNSVAESATALSGEERRGETEQRERQNGVMTLPPVENPTNDNGAGKGVRPEDRPTYAEACFNDFKERFQPGRMTMSSAEFALVSKWMDRNIPLAVVLRGIGETGGHPRTLLASEQAVERAVEYWASAAGLTGGAA